MLNGATAATFAVAIAGIAVVFPMTALTHDEWQDRSEKEWFQHLQRPDNDAYPSRKLDPKSLYCCGAADVVKTKFKVESAGSRYPEDTWYAWLKESWVKIPTFLCWPAPSSASCAPRAGFDGTRLTVGSLWPRFLARGLQYP